LGAVAKEKLRLNMKKDRFIITIPKPCAENRAVIRVQPRRHLPFLPVQRIVAWLLFFQAMAVWAWSQSVKPDTHQQQTAPGTPAGHKKRSVSGGVKTMLPGSH
jgi:hypothetical protein